MLVISTYKKERNLIDNFENHVSLRQVISVVEILDSKEDTYSKDS